MKSRISILFLCSGIAVGWQTTQNARSTSTPTSDCTAASPTVFGRVLSVENDARIEPGKLLCTGEMLQPASNANVTILCYKDGEMKRSPAGMLTDVSEICSSETPLLSKLNCPEPSEPCFDDNGRTASATNTPTIIRPDVTKVLTQTPTLSWYAVAEATHYNVSISDTAQSETIGESQIEGSDEEIRSIEFNDLEVPPLAWGTQYKLEVAAIFGNDERESKSDTSLFSTLEEAEAQKVNEIIAQLDRLNIPEEEKVLLDLLFVYDSRNLQTEAIDRLEQLVKAGSQNPKVYRQLGEIYLNLALLDLAESRFEQAKQLAIESGDSAEQESAQNRLNEITRSRESNDP